MASDNLDDLFRQQLGGHATPPGEDLQRRLAELAEAERLDALFRTGLGSLASRPRREVWERLEDEHLRPQPRRRRVVAWWQLSAAAVLLLTLLAGGLWQSGYLNPAGRRLASRPHSSRTTQPALAATKATGAQPAGAPMTPPAVVADLASMTDTPSEKNQKISATQATAPAISSSSPSIATTTRPRRAATAPQAVSSSRKLRQQPDAAAGQLASTGRRNSPASKTSPAPLAAPTAPASQPSLPVVAMTSASEVVEVEVRRGAEPSHAAAAPVVAAAEAPTAPDRRHRLRLGGLLRQADHLVHGEPLNLAEATGVAENVTVQARFGGRTLSKTIQL